MIVGARVHRLDSARDVVELAGARHALGRRGDLQTVRVAAGRESRPAARAASFDTAKFVAPVATRSGALLCRTSALTPACSPGTAGETPHPAPTAPSPKKNPGWTIHARSAMIFAAVRLDTLIVVYYATNDIG